MNDALKQTSSKKLLALKDDIANGRYHVSSEEIASAILNSKKNQD
jgi:anti-sigma28 factor (negative regulator of flagellin synthesis)